MHQLPEHMINDQFAKHAGIEPWWVEDDGGYWSASMEVKKHHLNGMGAVQGGAIFTLADYAFAIACNTDGRVSVAVQASANFVAPATVESGSLYAKVREVSRRRTVSVYLVEIRDKSGALIATFNGTALCLNRDRG